MPDVRLTSGSDLYVQVIPTPPTYDWTTVWGLEGDDTVSLYRGTFVGGPGNDTINKLHVPEFRWQWTVELAYWDSPRGIKVDWNTGQIQDGWGTQDTIPVTDLGFVRGVHGSGHADEIFGNAGDNTFWGNGGSDYFDGGPGVDDFGVAWWFDERSGKWSPPLVSDVSYKVSADGRSVTIASPAGNTSPFSIQLENVEYLTGNLFERDQWVRVRVEDLIRPLDVAQDVLAAGGAFRWNADQVLGSSTSVSFGFLKAADLSGGVPEGFREYSPEEMSTIRAFLQKTSSSVGIDFVELSGANVKEAQIRFGISQQENTKGVAYMPGQSGAGQLAGQVWMDVESLMDFRVGTEGFQAFVHELGHALGLRHLRNEDPGEAWSLEAIPRFDTVGLTVMSGEDMQDGLFRSDWGPLDLAALQFLYGKRAVNASDTYLRFTETDLQQRITISDSAGFDTLDFREAKLGVYVDLNPGGLSSVGATTSGFGAQQNLSIDLNSWIEAVVGSIYDDVLVGNAIDNVFRPLSGNDWIDGGAGVDMVVLPKLTRDYALEFFYESIILQARDGVSGFLNLENVEVLRFSDRAVSFETAAHAPYSDLPDALYHFFIVAFGAAPGVTYMNQLAEAYRYWMAPGDNSSEEVIQQVVDVFISKSQFTGMYPASMSHQTLADLLVHQIVRTSADLSVKQQAAKDIADALASGWSRGKVIYTVFGNLVNKPLDDAQWGGTARMFKNQIEIAKHYTDVLGYATTDLDNLRGAISKVTGKESLATHEEKFALILAGLLDEDDVFATQEPPIASTSASTPDLFAGLGDPPVGFSLTEDSFFDFERFFPLV